MQLTADDSGVIVRQRYARAVKLWKAPDYMKSDSLAPRACTTPVKKKPAAKKEKKLSKVKNVKVSCQ